MRKLSQFDAKRKQYLCFQGPFADIGPLPEPLSSILSDPQCTAYIERTHLQLDEEHTLIELSCRRISDNILMPAGLEWSLDWLIKQFKKYGIKTIIEYVSYGFSSRTAFRKAMAALTSDITPPTPAPISEPQMLHTAPAADLNICNLNPCYQADAIMMELKDSRMSDGTPLRAESPATPAATFAAAITNDPASNAWFEYLLAQPSSSTTEPWPEEAQWQSFRGMLCSSLDPVGPCYRPSLNLSAH